MTNSKAPHGYCPICGAAGKSREKRLDGNDKCQNGHTYSSKDSLELPFDKCEICYRTFGDNEIVTHNDKKYHLYCYLREIKFKDEVQQLEHSIAGHRARKEKAEEEIGRLMAVIEIEKMRMKEEEDRILNLCGDPPK